MTISRFEQQKKKIVHNYNNKYKNKLQLHGLAFFFLIIIFIQYSYIIIIIMGSPPSSLPHLETIISLS